MATTTSARLKSSRTSSLGMREELVRNEILSMNFAHYIHYAFVVYTSAFDIVLNHPLADRSKFVLVFGFIHDSNNRFLLIFFQSIFKYINSLLLSFKVVILLR